MWAGLLCERSAEALDPSSQESQSKELERVLSGFEDPPSIEDEQVRSSGDLPFTLGGRFALGTSFNFAHSDSPAGQTDWHGLSRFRLLAELEAELRLGDDWKMVGGAKGYSDFAYAIRGRQGYTPEVLDRYENELELDEVYVSGRLGARVHLKMGRQIAAWGTSDTIRIADLLNPLDLREPGLTDIEDLRLPVTTTRIDYVAGPWTVSGMALHEIRFNKNPAFGHDFYPYPVPLPYGRKPKSNLDNTEFAAAVRGSFRGWDVSLYWADVYDDAPHLEAVSPWQAELSHARIRMFGAAWDLARGDWLLKAEGAHLEGLEFFALPNETKSRTDVMVGFEYAGWSETTLTLEAANRHLHGWDSRLTQSPDLVEQDRFEWVFRLSRFFLNQTLMLSLVAVTYEVDGGGGAFQRLEARYDLSDQIEVVGGAVMYSSGDAPGLQGVGDNDRLFLDVSYRF